MNDEAHRLRVACLTGGYIIRVETFEEARKAQERGAVGVFIHPKTPWTAREFSNLLQTLSIHVMCGVGHRMALLVALENSALESRAGAFVITEAWDGLDLRVEPVLPVASSSPEIQRAAADGAALVILDNPSLFDSMPGPLRGNTHPPTAFFAQADGVEEALAALDLGLDGLLLNFLPDESQVARLRKAMLKPTPITGYRPDRFLVGVIALQGDYLPQKQLLEHILSDSFSDYQDQVVVETVRTASDLGLCDALLLPGGWSNLQSSLMDEAGLSPRILDAQSEEKPILAVCAGMVLAGTRPGEGCEHRRLLGLIDVRIENNMLNGKKCVHLVAGPHFEALFSNGPLAVDLGPEVETLAHLDGGEVVAARQGNVFISAYHNGPGAHDRFLAQCIEKMGENMHLRARRDQMGKLQARRNRRSSA